MPQRIAAQRNQDNNSMENLCDNLVQFPSRALQGAMTSHATEQVKSPRSGHATGQAMSLDDIIDECADVVFAKIEEWCLRNDQQTFYDEPALLKHKQMFDIMQCTKEGDIKEDTFLDWCRKMASLRMQVTSTATEHAESSTATEHAQSPEGSGKPWYKALGSELRSNELLPEQQTEGNV